MRIIVKNIDRDESTVVVISDNGEENEVIIEATEMGFSYTNIDDWPVDDEQHEALEDFCSSLGSLMKQL